MRFIVLSMYQDTPWDRVIGVAISGVAAHEARYGRGAGEGAGGAAAGGAGVLTAVRAARPGSAGWMPCGGRYGVRDA